MVKRRTTHLFIGLLRKTTLFPWTEPAHLWGIMWAARRVSSRTALATSRVGGRITRSLLEPRGSPP